MIRFAVIGTNWITESFIDAGQKLEDFSLHAVYSRTEEKAKEFAKKYQVETIYTDLSELAKSDQIDAVYIASPNSFHAKQAITLMEHGKHVLCEKPIASNTKELEAMIQTAKENQVLLMEAMKTTFFPTFESIKQNINKIGKIRRYFASSCKYSSRYDKYKEGIVLNTFNPIFSNGALMDMGIYCIYPAVTLFGEPKSVKANSVFLESGVDGEGSLLLQYEDMDAIIMYSKITESSIPSEIHGENGRIVIDKIHDIEKAEIHYLDGTIEDITVPQEKNNMYYEIKEFMNLINNHQLESTVNSYEHSMITAQIIEKARKEVGLIYPADKENGI